MTEPKRISAEEVGAHNQISDCWIVINSEVWDLTTFLFSHPGGADAIFEHAGKDASRAYNQVHSPNLVGKTLPASDFKGRLIDSLPREPSPPARNSGDGPGNLTAPSKIPPPLSTILSTFDCEAVAQDHLSKKAWAYYSAATDLISERNNRSMWDRIWFRPRLLRNVKSVSMECKIQGTSSSAPFFVAPAAMARLAHDSGELAIARACAKNRVVQCVSINSSYPVEEVVSAVTPDTPFFFQLYVNKTRSLSEAILKRVWDLNVRVLVLTVDAPVTGKREPDERVKINGTVNKPMTGSIATNDEAGSGFTRTMGTYIDSELCWNDLAWLRKIWKGQLVIKGIQSVEDAMMAAEMGAEGIILSNHGGRNLDTSPPALLVLIELQKHCPDIFQKMEVHIDGGVRRGTDILKAICLGATSVSIGRSFLYSLVYGEKGVEHLITLLKEELETAMKLIGITNLSQASPSLVNTQDLDHLAVNMVNFDTGVLSVRPKM